MQLINVILHHVTTERTSAEVFSLSVVQYFSLFFYKQKSKAKREGQKEDLDLEVASDPNNDKGKTDRVNYTP